MRAISLIATTACLAACTADPADPVAPNQEVLLEFEARVSAEDGTITLMSQTSRTGIRKEAVTLGGIPVYNDGTPGSGPADTVELVTNSTGTGLANCGRGFSFCGEVEIRSFFATQDIRGAHIMLLNMTPSTGNEAFGDNPDRWGLSGNFGLWNYGTIAAGGSVTRTWKFENASDADFTFRGRVMGELQAAADPVEANCTDATDNDGDGDFDCDDADCAADAACLGGEICGNGIDDDSNSDVDCDDAACAGDLSACAPTCAEAVSSAVTPGCQNWSGPLGLDFDVNNAITVTHLGFFDDDNDGIFGQIDVLIWNRATQTKASVELNFTAGNPGVQQGAYRYLPLPTPLDLPAGFQGTIAADGFNSFDLNGNVGCETNTTNTGGGLISFVGTARHGDGADTIDTFPTIIDGGPADRYMAGTFSFAAATNECTL